MEKKIKQLGVMLDCSRDAVYTVETLKKYIGLLSKMGYSSLQLYTEDVYTIDEPYFGYLRGRYSEEELKTLDAYATKQGIELIPCIQTLAHLGGFLRWKPEITDCGDILLVNCEETYVLIEKMFAACAECFTSRRINIGMDEAHMVGLGKYLENNGYQNRTDILLTHLRRVLEIAKKYGFKPMMWSDMFFRLANGGEYNIEEDSKQIPEEVRKVTPREVELVYWDYWLNSQPAYERMMKAHKKFDNKIIFAGGASSWTGFVPKNAGSITVTEKAIKACIQQDIDEIIITCWKDDGAECSLFASLPTLYFSAQMAQGNFEREGLEEGFNSTIGVSFDDFIALDVPDALDEGALWTNPSRYLLYSDPFLGILDNTVDVAKKSVYAKAEVDLAERAMHAGEYAYIFDTISKLCGVMKDKYSLGVETRAAYKVNDKQALSALVKVYGQIEERIEALYEAFRAQWMKECKPFGFEKQDIRLGGLQRRIRNCKLRLDGYCKGEISCIEELEEELLPYPYTEKGKTTCVNNWLNIAMLKPNM